MSDIFGMSGPCVCLGKATNTLSTSFRIVCNRIAREICAIFLRWLPYVAGRLGRPVPPNAGGCHSCAVGKTRRRKRGHFRPTRLQLPTPQGFLERSAGKLNFRSDAVDQVEIVRAGLLDRLPIYILLYLLRHTMPGAVRL